jgi:hypothetical protein
MISACRVARSASWSRSVRAIQQKLDRIDEAFLYSELIEVTSYGRQRDKLREELTLAQIDHQRELDVKGILAFAERILPRVRPLGASVARLQATAAAAVLSGRN